jgi:hypothetical protein
VERKEDEGDGDGEKMVGRAEMKGRKEGLRNQIPSRIFGRERGG